MMVKLPQRIILNKKSEQNLECIYLQLLILFLLEVKRKNCQQFVKML